MLGGKLHRWERSEAGEPNIQFFCQRMFHKTRSLFLSASLGTCAFDGLLYVCGKIFNKIEFSTKSLFAFSIHQEDTTVQAVCRQLNATTR
jgi:hypothetical protein